MQKKESPKQAVKREIYEELSDVAHMESPPSMEGRTMLMVLAPGADKRS